LTIGQIVFNYVFLFVGVELEQKSVQ